MNRDPRHLARRVRSAVSDASRDASKRVRSAVPQPWGGQLDQHRTAARLVPVGALLVFSAPAILVGLRTTGVVPRSVTKLSVAGIPAGMAFYYWVAARSTAGDPGWEPDDIPDMDSDRGLDEYRELGEEARYRDRLLVRTNYFSLTVFAVLVNLFVRVHHLLRPAVSVVGCLVAFAFAVAVTSYKSSRDRLRDRQETLEAGQRDREAAGPAVYHAMRGERNRTFFPRFSLSTLVANLHVFFLLLWLAVYLVSAVNGAFRLFPPPELAP